MWLYVADFANGGGIVASGLGNSVGKALWRNALCPLCVTSTVRLGSVRGGVLTSLLFAYVLLISCNAACWW